MLPGKIALLRDFPVAAEAKPPFAAARRFSVARLAHPAPVTTSIVISISVAISFSIAVVANTEAIQWSGRRESNPRNQFGKLMFYH